jgi:hypothetical protein
MFSTPCSVWHAFRFSVHCGLCPAGSLSSYVLGFQNTTVEQIFVNISIHEKSSR